MRHDLKNVSLDQLEVMYQNGAVSYEEVREYIREWNAGPVMTQAVCLRGGRIYNDYPERMRLMYADLKDEFGLRI